MGKKYKCPYCDKRYEREKLIDHIEDDHDELIPENQTPTQVVFNHINKKDHGTCVICKKPTKWNEKAGRYDRLCSKECKEKMREEFKKNAMNKDGTYVYTADPKFQEKMLRGRKISSTYKFTDGGKVDYVGSYEKKFLEFIDKVMNIESKDIIAPGPTIPYEYNGKTHYWITDFYYVPGNLVLDIKDGGKNPNNRPMEEYREKQLAKEDSIKKLRKYNYLRLTDNNFAQFMEVLADLKSMALNISERQLINKINESNIIDELSVGMMTVPPLYSSDASVLKAVDKKGKERTALSSLDFNDSILIDDPAEGIKKINKKYYKDNFETKNQFLYRKNESYYNLLKAYESKDPCIYEGIYKNLSSFDYILTENQIYFDKDFRLVNNNPLQEIQNKIKEVNDCIFCIGESTLIRNDKLNLFDNNIESANINNFYNELKTELESNTDGFFMIKPSKDKEDLDQQYQKYNAQNSDQKKKADIRSLALYGINNYDHYHILLSKIKKGTKDDELNGLEYNPHDEEIVKEEYNASEQEKNIQQFKFKDYEELKKKISDAEEFNKRTSKRVIIYPTNNGNILERLYMKYMALELNDRTASDNKAEELFGMKNREIYKLLKDNVIKTKNDDIEDKIISTDEKDNDSIISNDTPLVTPDELSKVEEDYSCFNEHDGNIIKKWRASYSLLNQGIKIQEYNKLNLDRINILRKSIYENNNEAIIQCGWIPSVEFNSENRVKATKIVRNKLDNLDAYRYIISYNKYMNESNMINHINIPKDKINDIYTVIKSLSKSDDSFDGIEFKNIAYYDIEYNNNTPVGFVLLRTKYDKEYNKSIGSIAIAISPKYRKKGIATKLSNNAINYFNNNDIDALLWQVKHDNKKSIKLANKLGFEYRRTKNNYDYYSIIKESYIEESKIVKPEKCNKCGSTNIGVFIQGEPIFKCKDCGEYLGTVPRHATKESYIEEANNDNKKAISIVLVSGNTFVGRTIKKVQGNEFSHASISLDDDLKRIYSFNKRNGFNGLAYESIKQYIKEGVDKIGVYTFLVSDSVYKSIEKTLDNFNLFINQTKYSILNLLTIPLHIPLNMDMKMVCSEFVDKLLKASSIDLTNKKSYFVTPKDLHKKVSTDIRIIEVFKGNPKDFNPNEISKRINKLKRSNLPVYNKFINESYIEEAKISSKIDSSHKNLNKLNLSSFRKIKISDSLTKKYSILKHIRINKNTNGYIYLDKNDKVVAVLNTENKEDGVWIQALEISKEYQNHGLSKQLLNVAIKEFKATKLSVNKNNEIAYSIYRTIGFKTEKETEKMLMMTLESYIEEAKSFPVQFDKEGNLIIKNIRKINFEQEYADSHRLLIQYNKTNAYEPMKFELAKMQFFITLLERKIYKQGKEKSKDELKVRARFLNDFKKYLKIVVDNDNNFNFGEYYEQSPFNDAIIKIDNSTLKYGWEALKYMIK